MLQWKLRIRLFASCVQEGECSCTTWINGLVGLLVPLDGIGNNKKTIMLRTDFDRIIAM